MHLIVFVIICCQILTAEWIPISKAKSSHVRSLLSSSSSTKPTTKQSISSNVPSDNMGKIKLLSQKFNTNQLITKYERSFNLIKPDDLIAQAIWQNNIKNQLTVDQCKRLLKLFHHNSDKIHQNSIHHQIQDLAVDIILKINGVIEIDQSPQLNNLPSDAKGIISAYLNISEIIQHYQQSFTANYAGNSFFGSLVYEKRDEFSEYECIDLAELLHVNSNKISPQSIHEQLKVFVYGKVDEFASNIMQRNQQMPLSIRELMNYNEILVSQQLPSSEVLSNFKQMIVGGISVWVNSQQTRIIEVINEYGYIARDGKWYNTEVMRLFNDKIKSKADQLNMDECMRLNEIFYNFGSKLQNKELMRMIKKRTPIAINEWLQAYLKPIGARNRCQFTNIQMNPMPVFLTKKHILDALQISFAVEIPDQCQELTINDIKFNENMLKVFRFGRQSQLMKISMYNNRLESLDMEHFGKYFPDYIRQKEGFKISVSKSDTLQGIIDVSKMGFTRLAALKATETRIEKIINIPHTMKYVALEEF